MLIHSKAQTGRKEKKIEGTQDKLTSRREILKQLNSPAGIEAYEFRQWVNEAATQTHGAEKCRSHTRKLKRRTRACTPDACSALPNHGHLNVSTALKTAHAATATAIATTTTA